MDVLYILRPLAQSNPMVLSLRNLSTIEPNLYSVRSTGKRALDRPGLITIDDRYN